MPPEGVVGGAVRIAQTDLAVPPGPGRRSAETRVRHGLNKLERNLPRQDRERTERELAGKRLGADAKPEDGTHSE